MRKPHGYIISHVNRNDIGMEAITHQWIGGPTASFSLRLLRDLPEFYRNLPAEGDGFVVGPYRLKIIEFDRTFDIAECVRMDYPFWRLHVFVHLYSRYVRIVKSKVILSLYIWGLADYRAGCIPSFMDIHAVRYMAGLFRRRVKQ